MFYIPGLFINMANSSSSFTSHAVFNLNQCIPNHSCIYSKHWSVFLKQKVEILKLDKAKIQGLYWVKHLGVRLTFTTDRLLLRNNTYRNKQILWIIWKRNAALRQCQELWIQARGSYPIIWVLPKSASTCIMRWKSPCYSVSLNFTVHCHGPYTICGPKSNIAAILPWQTNRQSTNSS